jgi:hypothetical protein
MKVKVNAGPQVRDHARQMLEKLANAATKAEGVYAYMMPGGSGVLRQSAARWLRQMGVAIYANRKGEDTVWYLLLDADKALADEWGRRVIADFYAEACRAHMALAPHKVFEDQCKHLVSVAVTAGAWLGYGIDRVLLDLAPQARPQWVKDTVDSIVVKP